MNNATYLGSFTVLPRPQKNAKTQNWGLQYQDMMSTPISGISRRNGSALMSGEYSVYIKEFQPADSEIPRVEISCICSKHDENYQNERVFDASDEVSPFVTLGSFTKFASVVPGFSLYP